MKSALACISLQVQVHSQLKMIKNAFCKQRKYDIKILIQNHDAAKINRALRIKTRLSFLMGGAFTNLFVSGAKTLK